MLDFVMCLRYNHTVSWLLLVAPWLQPVISSPGLPGKKVNWEQCTVFSWLWCCADHVASSSSLSFLAVLWELSRPSQLSEGGFFTVSREALVAPCSLFFNTLSTLWPQICPLFGWQVCPTPCRFHEGKGAALSSQVFTQNIVVLWEAHWGLRVILDFSPFWALSILSIYWCGRREGCGVWGL